MFYFAYLCLLCSVYLLHLCKFVIYTTLHIIKKIQRLVLQVIYRDKYKIITVSKVDIQAKRGHRQSFLFITIKASSFLCKIDLHRDKRPNRQRRKWSTRSESLESYRSQDYSNKDTAKVFF